MAAAGGAGVADAVVVGVAVVVAVESVVVGLAAVVRVAVVVADRA